MIDLWQLLQACEPDESGYFDDAVHRALEIAVGLPKDSIAWVHSRWPGIEFYLYDTQDTLRHRVSACEDLQVIVSRRPQDHGVDMNVDWVIQAVAKDERRRT